MQDNDSNLLWEAYQQRLNENLNHDEVMSAILKAWDTFMDAHPGSSTAVTDFEQPIRSDKESRDVAYRNANMPITPPGTGYSDEVIAKAQADIADHDKERDEMLADFYPILDQILDVTNKEVWFQVLQDIEQSEHLQGTLITTAMNKVWHNANPE
jgi:hypothetical protein